MNADRKVALDTLQFARQKWNKNEHYGKSVYHLRLIIFLQRDFDAAQTRANELNNLISSYGGSGNGTVEVRAAMSGTILEILGAVGSNVSSSTPIFKIANTSQLLAVVNVPADKLNAINPTNRVKVKPQSPTGTEEALGKIKYISDVIDTKTRTAKVFIEIPNQFKWRSGQLITAQILKIKVKSQWLYVKMRYRISVIGTWYSFVLVTILKLDLWSLAINTMGMWKLNLDYE